MTEPSEQAALDPELCAAAIEQCACFNFRRASRAITQAFDEALLPSGLRSTQLVILLAIHAGKSPSIAHLARELVMDASTLNRNLRPLIRKGWVENKAGQNGRNRLLSLTDAGLEAVTVAVPLWQQAQSQFVEAIEEHRWHELRSSMKRVLQTMGRG